MKTGELLEYNLRNIFLEKSHTKCGGETIPRLFSKKSKLSMSLNRYSKRQIYLYIYLFIYFVSIVCQVEDYRKWLKLSCRPPGFTSYKGFLTNKKKSGTSFPASFSAWLLNIFQCLIAFTSWDIGQCVHYHCLVTRLWRHICWN